MGLESDPRNFRSHDPSPQPPCMLLNWMERGEEPSYLEQPLSSQMCSGTFESGKLRKRYLQLESDG